MRVRVLRFILNRRTPEQRRRILAAIRAWKLPR